MREATFNPPEITVWSAQKLKADEKVCCVWDGKQYVAGRTFADAIDGIRLKREIASGRLKIMAMG